MNELEGEARPILKALIAGEGDVADLSPDQRLILGRWAAKTAYMINTSSNLPTKVPLSHLRDLRDHPDRLPERVLVVGQLHNPDRPFYWSQGSTWRIATPDPEVSLQRAEERREDSYKILLQFGSLLLLVAHWPLDRYRYVLWAGIHVPVWPMDMKLAFGRSEDGSDDEFPWNGVEAMAAFQVTFDVAEEGIIRQPNEEDWAWAADLKERFGPEARDAKNR